MNDTMHHNTDITSAVPDDMPNKREAIAGAFDHAADRLYDQADGMHGARFAGITNRTADALDATGRYVREFRSLDVVNDLTSMAKEHPGKSILVAMALGLLVGRVMTRPQA